MVASEDEEVDTDPMKRHTHFSRNDATMDVSLAKDFAKKTTLQELANYIVMLKDQQLELESENEWSQVRPIALDVDPFLGMDGQPTVVQMLKNDEIPKVSTAVAGFHLWLTIFVNPLYRSTVLTLWLLMLLHDRSHSGDRSLFRLLPHFVPGGKLFFV